MTVFYQDQAVQLLHGDVLAMLKTLPDEYVQTVVTSPPYYSLRDYQIPPQVWGGMSTCQHRWAKQAVTVDRSANVRWQHTEGGGGDGTMNRFAKEHKKADGDRIFVKIDIGTCRKCGAWRGSLGLEPTPELYVQHVIEVFREVRRVLRLGGTVFLNLGDSYHQGNKGQSGVMKDRYKQASNVGSLATRRGEGLAPNRRLKHGILKPKDRYGIPHRITFALQADGWWWRDEIIWNKNNPMPSSAIDRCTMSHEFVFMFTKSARYFYDQAAIREPAIYAEEARYDNGLNGHAGGVSHVGQGSSTRKFRSDKQRGHGRLHAGFNDRWDKMSKEEQCSGMRNKRSVWEVATQPFPEAHFATFPEKLIEPCILAGAPEGGLVLDPFAGAGTTLLVAKKLNRKALGIELSEAYCAMIAKRIQLESARLL